MSDPKFMSTAGLMAVEPQTILRGASGDIYIRLDRDGVTDQLRGDWIGWFKVDPDGHMWSVIGLMDLINDQPLEQPVGWKPWPVKEN